MGAEGTDQMLKGQFKALDNLVKSEVASAVTEIGKFINIC